ncbi:MFS transporter [Streptomyces sp. NPDC046805]|uniref:MFS transporter n=1 Tax=Streptomyces sp. NPDC046805 TaxID=3155134 RepID=UPI0033CC00D8
MSPQSTPSGPHPAETTVSGRLDRLPITSVHRRATMVVGLGFFFDLFEVFLAGVLAVVLVERFHVTKDTLPVLLSSAYIGAFLGAILVSRLGDRYGRSTAFLFTLGVYSVFSFLGAFSASLSMLVATRFLAGIGIGAELPLGSAYLADLMPRRVRGRAIAIAFTLGFLGVPAVGLLGRSLLPHQLLGLDGWRWLMVIGSLGAVIIWFLRRSLPESPRWLESVGRHEEAEAIVAKLERTAVAEHGELTAPEPASASASTETARVPLRVLFTGQWRRRTAMLWIFQSVQTVGYYGFGSLVPLILTAKGYSVTSSLTFTAITYFGYPIGSALSIPLMERVQRKWIVVGAAAAMIVLGLAFGNAGSSAAIVTLGFLYTLASNFFSNGFHAYEVELYPTQVRTTAAGTAYSLSRLTTAFMPFVLVPLLHDRGPSAVFGVIVAAMVVVIADVAVLGPKTTGLSLESINTRHDATVMVPRPSTEAQS